MTVVVGYVSSDEGRAALSHGFQEAALRSTGLTVVCDAAGARSGDLDADVAAARTSAEKDVPVVVREVDADRTAVDELVDPSYEDGVDLIVIGLRRRSAIGKLLMGSNAQRILLQAHCPVTAVKPPVGAPA